MTIKAIIFDLDNTIYPVTSISDELFGELFSVLDEAGVDPEAKQELTRRPFQWIADKFGFDEELKEKCLDILRHLSYDKPMVAFEDYHLLKGLTIDKFLVTTGFPKLQWSKIRMLNLEPDFKGIHVVDPDTSDKTKKDIFLKIQEQHHYEPREVLVVGDDPVSEIKAGSELGMVTFLFDPAGKYPNGTADYQSHRLRDAAELIV